MPCPHNVPQPTMFCLRTSIPSLFCASLIPEQDNESTKVFPKQKIIEDKFRTATNVWACVSNQTKMKLKRDLQNQRYLNPQTFTQYIKIVRICGNTIGSRILNDGFNVQQSKYPIRLNLGCRPKKRLTDQTRSPADNFCRVHLSKKHLYKNGLKRLGLENHFFQRKFF